jgi:hypothetical protein
MKIDAIKQVDSRYKILTGGQPRWNLTFFIYFFKKLKNIKLIYEYLTSHNLFYNLYPHGMFFNFLMWNIYIHGIFLNFSMKHNYI